MYGATDSGPYNKKQWRKTSINCELHAVILNSAANGINKAQKLQLLSN